MQKKLTFPTRLNPARMPTLSQWVQEARAGRQALLMGAAMFAAFFLFLALIQFSTPDLPDNDGFYHIKLAYLMRVEGLKPAFPWLPLSILNARAFYDHHFLFHVALIPFTFGDLAQGAKWAAVLFGSLAMFSVWNLFQNQRIPYAALWALGMMAVSEAFLYRMSITRAQSLSLAALMLGLDWLLRGKHRRLAPLAFIYVWLYDAFPLLLVTAGVYVVAVWITEGRLDARPLVYAAAGTALGLLINPYFPHNIVFAAQHILPKLVEATSVSVGNEWYPYTTAQLLENSTLALAAFLSGGLALGLSGKRIDLRALAAFGLACLFGLMLLQARRFVEYFPPFALAFAAFAWTPVIEDFRSRRTTLPLPTRKFLLARKFLPPRRFLPPLLLALALIPGAWVSLRDAQELVGAAKPRQTYAGASAWLAANTPAGSRVFQTDWDDFPRLFFYNTHNTYLIGLDPTYMQIYDADLYDLWVNITRGDVEQPSAIIRSDFGSRYALTDLRHGDFLDAAKDDPNMVEVYRDADAVIFEITGE